MAGAQPQAGGDAVDSPATSHPGPADSPPINADVDLARAKAAIDQLLEHATPAELDELRRLPAQLEHSIDFYLAGYGRWPDVGNSTSGTPCCMAARLMGHQWCTCWTPVFDVDQAPPRTELAAGLQPSMCGDCAYRPRSPERTGHPDARNDADDLHHLVVSGNAFWCHQGMRRPTHWAHPSGATVPASPTDYRPHIDAITRTPYQADGTPGLLCAGWVALRLKHVQRDIPGKHLPANVTAADLVAHGPQIGSGNTKRRCEACGCTDDRACIGGCAWVAPDVDLCTRCQPFVRLVDSCAVPASHTNPETEA